MDARERFQQWRKGADLSQSEAAELIGCAQSLVSAIERGAKRPGLTVAFTIERLTAEWAEGPILARDWAPEPTDTPTV